jgi:hypothetical protein
VTALIALSIVGSGTTRAVDGLLRETAAETLAPRALVSTTGNQSERVRTIPITRQPGLEKRVVMSMEPQAVPDFVPGDRMKVTADVQFTFTVNCLPRTAASTALYQAPYNYDPVVHTSLMRADGEETTAAGVRCGFPLRRGIFAASGSRFASTTAWSPSPRPDSRFPRATRHRVGSTPCRVNLVAEADHPDARSGQKLIVGGSKASGEIPQDRGRINAIRFHPGDQPETPALQTTRRVQEQVVSDLQKHVVYSQMLPQLESGEQLQVSGKLETDILPTTPSPASS